MYCNICRLDIDMLFGENWGSKLAVVGKVILAIETFLLPNVAQPHSNYSTW